MRPYNIRPVRTVSVIKNNTRNPTTKALYQDLKKASQESGHIGILKFSYEYTCNGKKYKEEASVNISLNEDHAVTIIGENEKPDLAISNILHERNVHNL